MSTRLFLSDECKPSVVDPMSLENWSSEQVHLRGARAHGARHVTELPLTRDFLSCEGGGDGQAEATSHASTRHRAPGAHLPMTQDM